MTTKNVRNERLALADHERLATRQIWVKTFEETNYVCRFNSFGPLKDPTRRFLIRPLSAQLVRRFAFGSVGGRVVNCRLHSGNPVNEQTVRLFLSTLAPGKKSWQPAPWQGVVFPPLGRVWRHRASGYLGSSTRGNTRYLFYSANPPSWIERQAVVRVVLVRDDGSAYASYSLYWDVVAQEYGVTTEVLVQRPVDFWKQTLAALAADVETPRTTRHRQFVGRNYEEALAQFVPSDAQEARRAYALRMCGALAGAIGAPEVEIGPLVEPAKKVLEFDSNDNPLVAELLAQIRSPRTPLEQRLRLAQLCQALASSATVPILIECLAVASPKGNATAAERVEMVKQIRGVAAESLHALTGEKFGEDLSAWRAWYSRKKL